jgi:long-chain acyl-CoA synthetase
MFKDLIGVYLSEKEYFDTAIIDYCDGKSRFFTYRNLESSSENIAKWLLSQNLPRGSRIAIISENSFEYISVFFGVRLASMVPILINTKLPENYLKTIFNENSVNIIFCDDNSKEKIKERNVFLLKNIKNLSYEKQEFKFLIDKKDPAFILYTSGSSGVPKGILISNEARLWTVETLKSSEQFKRKFISPNPLFHMNGISVLEVNLGSHETTVLLPYFEVELFLSMAQKHRVISWTLVAPMMSMILARRDLLDSFPKNRVMSISLGSSPVSEKLFYSVKKEFSNALIAIRYGLSEVGASIFKQHPDGKTVIPDMSVGYPRNGIEYKLVDDVLWLKSPGMFSSYLNNENRLDSEGFFNTKDKFKIDDQGFYYFIGREDDMFVCGGDNIYPLEIEKIINSHPDVENSSVIGIDDEIKGKKPFAFVKLKKNSILNSDNLRDFFLKNHTINHCPRGFYIIDDFPLTGTGKIDKEQLEKMVENKNHV